MGTSTVSQLLGWKRRLQLIGLVDCASRILGCLGYCRSLPLGVLSPSGACSQCGDRDHQGVTPAGGLIRGNGSVSFVMRRAEGSMIACETFLIRWEYSKEAVSFLEGWEGF